MYKNALKEDLIRVVEDLDGTVESTDTIVKLKTKIENSSTFESDPDFVKTLIQNCIDEREYRKTKESPGSGNEGKREIVLNRRPELYRGKYRCVQPKINLLKDVLMPVKQCFPVGPSGYSLWYPWKGKKEYVPLRTAYSQDSRYGMQPKARQSSRAGAAKTRTETFELVEEKQKLLDIRIGERKENAREAGIEKKDFDFDQSLEREQKPSVERRAAIFRKLRSACVEVGTHRRKFRLCRGRNYNFTNTCEEVSIRTISTILPAKRKADHIKETPITYGYTQDPFKNRSQNFKTKIKENYPQYLERKIKNCFICGDSSHCARDCEKRFKLKEPNDHIHKRINVNTLKIESEKQNSDEFEQFQYVNIFVENQPVTALIDSGCQIPVLNSSLIRVQTPSEEIITLSSCFGEQRMVELKPINISLNQHSPGLSVRTAISPTLTEEFIIHPSVYSEIKKLGHAKSDVLLNESESSLGAHACVHFNSNVSVSNVIENSSYDLPHVKNFNTRNDSSSLNKDYKCNKN
ncbi:hypothetical protein TNCV_4154141 [Trichonephila clavipes]|nr:hypothetical protein TNCV_4154141 [Trichonephila clavipes]